MIHACSSGLHQYCFAQFAECLAQIINPECIAYAGGIAPNVIVRDMQSHKTKCVLTVRRFFRHFHKQYMYSSKHGIEIAAGQLLFLVTESQKDGATRMVKYN